MVISRIVAIVHDPAVLTRNIEYLFNTYVLLLFLLELFPSFECSISGRRHFVL